MEKTNSKNKRNLDDALNIYLKEATYNELLIFLKYLKEKHNVLGYPNKEKVNKR